MKIAGLQKVSLIDYPGRIAATVFLAGCNLCCSYCYNRWMIDEAHVLEAMTPAECLAWLERRGPKMDGLLDGVCISGGEPTLHVDVAFLRAVKNLGLAIKLDTNGTFPERVAALLHEGLIDYVALDLKAPFDARYAEVTGCPTVDIAAIRRTMDVLRAWVKSTPGSAYEYRTTVIPSLDDAALQAMASELLPGERWVLQPFVPAPGVSPALAQLPAPDEAALLRCAASLISRAPGVCVRGVE